MNRRNFIKSTASVGGLGLIAGCSQTTPEEEAATEMSERREEWRRTINTGYTTAYMSIDTLFLKSENAFIQYETGKYSQASNTCNSGQSIANNASDELVDVATAATMLKKDEIESAADTGSEICADFISTFEQLKYAIQAKQGASSGAEEFYNNAQNHLGDAEDLQTELLSPEEVRERL